MRATPPADGLPPARLVADRTAMTRDALIPVLLAGSVLFALLAVGHLVLEPAPQGRPLAGVAGVLAVLFGLARAACVVPWWARQVHAHADEVGLGAGLLASLHVLALLLVTGEPTAAGSMILFIVVSGALMTVRRHAVVVVAAGTVQWLSVAAAEGFSGEWGRATLMVMCAPVLAQVLFTARCRAADSLVAAQAAVLEAAMTDELTGLVNRRGLLAAGRAVLTSSRDVARPVSLLFLDLDGLKTVNDRHGHGAGDALLRVAATALRAAMRPADLVARLGGDEFAVLLDGADAAQAMAVRDRLEVELAVAGVQASTGAAQAKPGQTVEELLDTADAAMYVVKQARSCRPADGQPASRIPVGPVPATPACTGPGVQVVADLAAVTRTGALLFTALVPVHVLMQPGARGAVLAALALAIAVTFGVVHGRREHPAVRRHAEIALAGCLWLVAAQTVALVVVVGQAWATTAVLLAVLAVGALVRSRLHATVVMLSTAAAWAAVAAAYGWGAEWGEYALHLGTAVVIGGVLHVAHARTFQRLTLAQQQVRVVALTDELTGLSNRRGFLTRGCPLLERGRDVSVLLLDLDGLKQVNDTRGHAAGDRLLTAAAEVLLRCSGPDALCARLGGDEFTVLLSGHAPGDVPAQVDLLERALQDADVRASIGTAHLPQDATSLEGLLDRADAAMYAVKRERRAREALPG